LHRDYGVGKNDRVFQCVILGEFFNVLTIMQSITD